MRNPQHLVSRILIAFLLQQNSLLPGSLLVTENHPMVETNCAGLQAPAFLQLESFPGAQTPKHTSQNKRHKCLKQAQPFLAHTQLVAPDECSAKPSYSSQRLVLKEMMEIPKTNRVTCAKETYVFLSSFL